MIAWALEKSPNPRLIYADLIIAKKKGGELNHHACFLVRELDFFPPQHKNSNRLFQPLPKRHHQRTSEFESQNENPTYISIQTEHRDSGVIPPQKRGAYKSGSPPPSIHINKYIHVAATKPYILSRVVNTNITKLQLNYEKKINPYRKCQDSHSHGNST